MKKLYLVRHAKAASRDSRNPDLGRPLLKKGKQDVRKIAKKLRQNGSRPDVIVSSSANRACQSASIVAKTLGYKKKIVSQNEVYEANQGRLMKIVRKLKDGDNTVMIVGHNPAINELAGSLVKGFDQAIPTSGIVGIDLPVETWTRVRKGLGQLSYFDFPKKKQVQAKLLKKIEQDIASEVTRVVNSALKHFGGDSAAKMNRSVKTASRRVAREFVDSLKARKVSIRPKSQPLPEKKAARKPRKRSVRTGAEKKHEAAPSAAAP